VSSGNLVAFPKYIVEIKLSPAAAQKLASSGETIRVWASYYGTAAPDVPGGDDGEIQLASEIE
jgi:hypothetical protein